MPEISIIVPVYNVEKYLPRCIDSILSQTFRDFELILIDDGSTDRSGQICDEYKNRDHRINVIHKQNGGVSAARNSGLQAAGGTYVMFCDSDDWVEANWCGSLHQAMMPDNAILAICGVKRTDQTGNVCSCMKLSAGSVALKDFVDVELMPFSYNKIFIRKFIVYNNLKFPLNISYAEDHRFVHEYLRVCPAPGRIVTIADEPYNYRATPNSLSCRYYSNFFEMKKEIRSMVLQTAKLLKTDEKKYLELEKNTAWYGCTAALNHIFSKANPQTYWRKYSSLKVLMHCCEYSYAIQSPMMNTLHPLYRFFLRKRLAMLILFYSLIKK